MPILNHPEYQPPLIFKYHHFATIIPAFFRTVKNVAFYRERWTTPDQDFLDLDWSKVHSKKLAVVLHGLEGSSESSYVKGVIKMFNHEQWDGVALNFRGCSGAPNLVRRSYHSGETTDLDFVLGKILNETNYEEIVLVGFSLGGNVVLKYGGEKGKLLNSKIKKIVGVSVPIDLAGCSMEISKWHNYIYIQSFMNSLKNKFKLKQHLYPEIDPKKIFGAKNFKDFDQEFTAPVHGFESAEDYWEKCSSQHFLSKISVPTLIISAQDDSFLSDTCYPFDQAEDNSYLHLLAPKFGGHVGFPQNHKRGYFWTEERIFEFIQS